MPIKPDTLFPAAPLYNNLRSAESLGIDLAALYGALPALPQRPEGEVPFSVYLAFWQAVARAYGKPGVVSAVAMSLPFGSFGVLDYLAGSAQTMRGALETARLHLSLVAFGEQLEIGDSGDERVWVAVRAPEPGAAIGGEYTLAVIAQRMRYITDGRAVPLAVTMGVEAGPDETVRTRLYGLRPTFAQPVFALAYAADGMDQPLIKADPLLHATLRKIVAGMAVADAPADDLELALRSRLRDALADGDAAAARLARLLGLSERTLQRRLTAVGRSYGAVLEDFRREEAARLLRAGSLPLVRVAERLGYAEQASFTRAFRRWHGASPAAWRRAVVSTPAQQAKGG
jgi:AraC-like DNA-binding protein